MTTDQQYLNFDWFAGERDVNIKCRTVAIVTVRKEHPCYGVTDPDSQAHTIKPGERARYETALIDSDYWGRYYVCLPCIDRWLTKYERTPLEETK